MNTSDLINKLEQKNPGEKEFLQAVREVSESIEGFYNQNPHLEGASLIERLTEPDRVISFKVTWQDDRGKVHVNRGYRIQFNNALGPYKGGLRFHPSVNQSILKFLAFEQIFKNALTGLPMGGGKGGSDFNPKGKSEGEMMRFCQAFMTELWNYIGASTDVPAGDIGVGGREIGYLYGQYKRLSRKFEGSLTGKNVQWGGSWIRKQATGYGLVYLTQHYLHEHNDDIKDKKVLISGAGNVAIYAAEKIQELGGQVITMSDSDGCIIDPKGIDLDLVKEIKEMRRGRIKEYLDTHSHAEYNTDRNAVWKTNGDIALPCATENELNLEAAKTLVDNNIICVAEGANMPCTPDAVDYFIENKTGYIPGKAANAGGVAVSGLEMTQNAMKLMWQPEEVDTRLHQTMERIHTSCVKYGKEDDGYINYVNGANIAGFIKVAEAIIAQGII